MIDICRLCLTSIPEVSNKLLYDDDCITLETKIKLLMPEVDINITPTFTLCSQCSHSLNTAYIFKCECIQVEELIKKYISDTKTTLLDLQLVRNRRFCDEENNCEEKIKVEIHDENEDIEEIVEVPNIKDLDVNFICDKCHETFCDEEMFGQHRQDCVFYKCDQCDRKFITEPQLEKHQKSHITLKPFLCETCNKSFRRPYELKQHVFSHSDNPPIICDICNKTFLTEKSLQKHGFIHLGREKRYFCDICNNSYYKLCDLKRHQEIHNDGDHKCVICEKSFSVSLYLQRHMENTHFGKFICDTCGIKCGSKNVLLEHIRTHTGERPYKCEICGKGFAQKSTLGVHIKCSHNDEKPFVCETCGKAFTLKGSLKIHLATHMDNVEKKHICTELECNKTFRTIRDLQKHVRRHSAIKTHKCSICDKGFLESTALKIHMRSHTGERPYECYTCHKRFSQKYNLQIHFRSHKSKST